MQDLRFSYILHKGYSSGTGETVFNFVSVLLKRESFDPKLPPGPCCGLGYRAITVNAVVAYFRPFENEIIISPLMFLPVPECPLVVNVF